MMCFPMFICTGWIRMATDLPQDRRTNHDKMFPLYTFLVTLVHISVSYSMKVANYMSIQLYTRPQQTLFTVLTPNVEIYLLASRDFVKSQNKHIFTIVDVQLFN